MNVLSLFDGMACGMLAMQKVGINVTRYVAYEIDKYAVQTSSHNFPMIEHRGDVFRADFTEFRGFDFLVGGSPCTYWSIAQKNNRETEASGMGWELFSRYVRALHEAQPKWFIYENNKSMSKAIRASIDEAFGFDAVCINSALVSAQNRQRLYWVGKRNEDGTYSKVHVEQPEDLGILLKDILESGQAWQDKSFAHTTRCQAGTPHDTLEKHRHTMVAEPACVAERGRYAEDGSIEQRFEAREDGKTNVLTTVQKDNYVAEPVCVQEQVFGRQALADGTYDRRYWARCDGKSGTLTGTMRQNAVAVPVASTVLNVNPSGKGMNGAVSRIDAKTRCLATNKGEGPKVIIPLNPVRVGALPRPNGELSTSQAFRVYSTDGKSVNITAGGGGAGGKTGLYAIPVEFEGEISTKAISVADGKTYSVYEVKDGFITIKGKRYPIKLPDGFYIIRKLTVRECMRLQTVPEWYEFPVSDSQAYKMLGNGWTVYVIAHILCCVNTGNA